MTGSLGALLAAGRRRIRLAWAAATVNVVLPATMGVLAVVAVVAWLARRPLPWWSVLAVPIVALAAIALAAVRQRFAAEQVARTLELRAGCDGVLVSALQFVDVDNDWHVDVQRRAEAIADDASIVRTIPIRIDHRRLGAAFLAAGLAVALSVISPLGGDGKSASAADVSALDAEATRLEQAAEALDDVASSADPDDESLAAVADELRRMADEVREAPSIDEAAADLERAAEALRQQLGDDFLAEKAAVQGLEQQLAATPLTPAGGGDAAGQLDGAAEALETMTPDELAALAERLEALAESQAAGNRPVADELRNAAAGLRAGDLGAASSALSSAAGAQRTARDDVEAGSVSSAAANAASGSARRLRDPASASDGDGQGDGDGAGDGQGTGEGQGSGQGQGQGQGSGQGQGQGQGGQGGQGADGGAAGQVGGAQPGSGGAAGQGGQGAVGSNNGPEDTTPIDRATVFDPAAGGPSEEVQVGIDGGQGDGEVVGRQDGMTTDGVSLVPYQDVLPDYLADAAAALDDLQLPAELRSVVADYFDNLARASG